MVVNAELSGQFTKLPVGNQSYTRTENSELHEDTMVCGKHYEYKTTHSESVGSDNVWDQMYRAAERAQTSAYHMWKQMYRSMEKHNLIDAADVFVIMVGNMTGGSSRTDPFCQCPGETKNRETTPIVVTMAQKTEETASNNVSTTQFFAVNKSACEAMKGQFYKMVCDTEYVADCWETTDNKSVSDDMYKMSGMYKIYKVYEMYEMNHLYGTYEKYRMYGLYGMYKLTNDEEVRLLGSLKYEEKTCRESRKIQYRIEVCHGG